MVLGACAPLPDTGAAARNAADLPETALVPVDTILDRADALTAGDGGTGALEARAAALRARAAALRNR